MASQHTGSSRYAIYPIALKAHAFIIGFRSALPDYSVTPERLGRPPSSVTSPFVGLGTRAVRSRVLLAGSSASSVEFPRQPSIDRRHLLPIGQE